jgi:hypothetical protein
VDRAVKVNNKFLQSHHSARASLKHAPPPTALSVSGANAVAVWPFFEALRHAPLGIAATPGRIISLNLSRQCTSPQSLKTRTISPFLSARDFASAGCKVTKAPAD